MEEIGSMSTLVGWLQEIVPGKYSEETGIYPYLLQFLVWLCMTFYMHAIEKDMDPAFKRALFEKSVQASGQYELPIDINDIR